MAHGIFNLIKRMSDNREQITIPKLFVAMTGDLVTAAVLKQIIFWSDKKDDGWFYKTYDQWNEEIGVSQFQIKSAITGDKRYKKERLTLKDIGVEVKRARMPNGRSANYYRINESLFVAVVIHFLKHLVMPKYSELSSLYQNELSTDYQNELSSPSIIQKETKTESNKDIKEKRNKKDAAKSAAVFSPPSSPIASVKKKAHPTIEEKKAARLARSNEEGARQLDAKFATEARPADPMRVAVAEIWPSLPVAAVMNDHMSEMLQGRGRLKKYAECALAFKGAPVTPDELRACFADWKRERRKHMSNDPLYLLPDQRCKSPLMVQSAIEVWRAKQTCPVPTLAPIDSRNSILAEG